MKLAEVMTRYKWLKTGGRAALLAGLLASYQPAVAQTAGQQALALAPRVQQAADQRLFDRATLPLYRRALRLDAVAHNDTLLAHHAYYAGRCYFNAGPPDSALLRLRQSWDLSRRTGLLEQAIRAGNFLNLSYGQLAQADSQRATMARMRAFYPRTRPNTAAREALDNVLGGDYQDAGRYPESLRHRLAQLAYWRPRNEPGSTGVALVNIGEVFYLQGQFSQSLRYHREALTYLQRVPTYRNILFQTYGLLGKAYREAGLLDSAQLSYETALRLAGPAGEAQDPDIAVGLHAELCAVLGQHGRLALARQQCQLALAASARSTNLDLQAQVQYYAGELEIKCGNFAAARAHLLHAYALARRIQSPDRLEPITKLLAEAEARTGHYAEAYRLRDLSAQLLDSAHVAAGQQAVAAMEARYQNQDKQRLIQLLNGENRLRVAEAAAQRQAKYLAWVGVGGLLLVLGIIGYLLRQRQRTAALLATQNATLASLNQRLNGSNAQLAEANQTKTKLFSIISHDLRAPVGNLAQLLELTEEAPDLLDPATRQQQVRHLRRTTSDLLDTLDELLAWSKDQLDHLDPAPAVVALPDALAELAALYQPLAERKGVALTVECPPALVARTDPNFLRVVLRNLVQNAIKFTPAGGQVRLSAEAAPPGLVLRVADTGPGLSAAQLAQALGSPAAALPPGPTHGLGLQLTREFVAKLGGVLRLEPASGQGTVLVVELPG